MGLFGKKDAKAKEQQAKALAEEADASVDAPNFIDLQEKKAEWMERRGMRCYQVPALNLLIQAHNDQEVVLAHLEPGIVLAIFPPGEDEVAVARKSDVAVAAVEEVLKDSVQASRDALPLGWSKHYFERSRDDWAKESPDVRDAMQQGDFGLVTFIDHDWLAKVLGDRAAAHGLTIVTPIDSVVEESTVMVSREAKVPIPMLRHLIEMCADVNPIEYLLQRIDAAAVLEKKVAKWSGEVDAAGIRAYDPGKDSALAVGQLTRWTGQAGDEEAAKSPQIAAIKEFMQTADGVESLVWEYLFNRYPAPESPRQPGLEGETCVVMSGRWAATVDCDEEKGIKIYFDHHASNLEWRVWTLKKLAELAGFFKEYRKSDGHKIESETGGLGHFSAILRSLPAMFKDGRGGSIGVRVRDPGKA